MAAADNRNGSGFNTPAVLLSVAAAVILLFAMSLFIRGGFLAAQAREYETKVYQAAGSEQAGTALAEQQAILDEQTRWLDEDSGRLCMPIEDAEARYVEKVAAGR